jgi:hypothetical protein
MKILLSLLLFSQPIAIAQQPTSNNLSFYPRADNYNFQVKGNFFNTKLPVRQNDIINEWGYPITPVIGVHSQNISGSVRGNDIDVSIDMSNLHCGEEHRFYLNYYLAIDSQLSQTRSLNDALVTISVVKQCE